MATFVGKDIDPFNLKRRLQLKCMVEGVLIKVGRGNLKGTFRSEDVVEARIDSDGRCWLVAKYGSVSQTSNFPRQHVSSACYEPHVDRGVNLTEHFLLNYVSMEEPVREKALSIREALHEEGGCPKLAEVAIEALESMLPVGSLILVKIPVIDHSGKGEEYFEDSPF
jgi:hypothetical protein